MISPSGEIVLGTSRGARGLPRAERAHLKISSNSNSTTIAHTDPTAPIKQLKQTPPQPGCGLNESRPPSNSTVPKTGSTTKIPPIIGTTTAHSASGWRHNVQTKAAMNTNINKCAVRKRIRSPTSQVACSESRCGQLPFSRDVVHATLFTSKIELKISDQLSVVNCSSGLSGGAAGVCPSSHLCKRRRHRPAHRRPLGWRLSLD
jgi:hypothetical protein